MVRVIGMGSGRCGTKTLAKLIDGIHEPNPKLPWNKSLHKIKPHLNSEENCVALYYGPYWQDFSNTRFIVLQRDKEETVQSFLDITPGRDHWSEPNNELWDMCFPSYPDLDKRASIEKYYDEYYEMMPEDALWIKTEDLSKQETQEKIFNYAQIDGTYQDIVANKREDHAGYKRHNSQY